MPPVYTPRGPVATAAGQQKSPFRSGNGLVACKKLFADRVPQAYSAGAGAGASGLAGSGLGSSGRDW